MTRINIGNAQFWWESRFSINFIQYCCKRQCQFTWHCIFILVILVWIRCFYSCSSVQSTHAENAEWHIAHGALATTRKTRMSSVAQTQDDERIMAAAAFWSRQTFIISKANEHSEIYLRRRANEFRLQQTVYQSTYVDAIKLNCNSCESMELVILTNFARYVAVLIEPIAFYLFHRYYCLSLMAAASDSISIFRWNVPLPNRLTYLWNYGVCLSISFINFCMPAPAFVTKFVSLPSGVRQFFIWHALNTDSNRSASFAHTAECVCVWTYFPTWTRGMQKLSAAEFSFSSQSSFRSFSEKPQKQILSNRNCIIGIGGRQCGRWMHFFHSRFSVHYYNLSQFEIRQWRNSNDRR